MALLHSGTVEDLNLQLGKERGSVYTSWPHNGLKQLKLPKISISLICTNILFFVIDKNYELRSDFLHRGSIWDLNLGLVKN